MAWSGCGVAGVLINTLLTDRGYCTKQTFMDDEWMSVTWIINSAMVALLGPLLIPWIVSDLNWALVKGKKEAK